MAATFDRRFPQRAPSSTMTASACATSASAAAASPRSAISIPRRAGEVVDCAGLHILPGVIDTQVHFREPGAEHKEDLETGSRAAVMGGVTAVFEMPNTSPLTVTAEALADKLARAPRAACIATSPSSSAAPTTMSKPCRRARAPAGRCRHQDLHGLVDRRSARRRRRGPPRDPRARPGAASPSIPRTSRGSASALGHRVDRRSRQSHPIWRDETPALRATERLVAHRRARPAPASIFSTSRPPRRSSCVKDHQGQCLGRADAAAPDPRRRRLCPARHAGCR